jgi:hypothetical protein
VAFTHENTAKSICFHNGGPYVAGRANRRTAARAGAGPSVGPPVDPKMEIVAEKGRAVRVSRASLGSQAAARPIEVSPQSTPDAFHCSSVSTRFGDGRRREAADRVVDSRERGVICVLRQEGPG